jgi:hypothetical protein
MQGRELTGRQVPELEPARLVLVEVSVLQEVEPPGLVEMHLGGQPDGG